MRHQQTEKTANRMEVLSCKDLPEAEAILAMRQARKRLWNENMSKEQAKEVYDLVGGRLSTLSRLAKKKDPIAAAKDRIEQEKQWLLSKVGLIPDHDDGVLCCNITETDTDESASQMSWTSRQFSS